MFVTWNASRSMLPMLHCLKLTLFIDWLKLLIWDMPEFSTRNCWIEKYCVISSVLSIYMIGLTLTRVVVVLAPAEWKAFCFRSNLSTCLMARSKLDICRAFEKITTRLQFCASTLKSLPVIFWINGLALWHLEFWSSTYLRWRGPAERRPSRRRTRFPGIQQSCP